MNEHSRVSELLPFYVSGGLDRDQRQAVDTHLTGCAECQADLALWMAVAGEVTATSQEAAAPQGAPQGVANRALAEIRQLPRQASHRTASSLHAKLQRALQLLRSQMPLVQREIWPATAAVVAIGYMAALIAERAGFIYALAPLMAAACVSLIYGPENDPAYELALSTPTSPRQILLARLVLVFGYNLGLVLIATLGLLPFLQEPLFGSLVLGWLAPMTFLSAAALVLSLWIGAPNAISITYAAWIMALFAGPLRGLQAAPAPGILISPVVTEMANAYYRFWQNPSLLLALSAALFALAVWLAGRQEHATLNPA